jgi:uncharacterized protein
MRTLRHLLRALTCCIAFVALPAPAALPDPVRFANVVELRDIRTVRGWLDEGLSPNFMGSRFGTGLMIAAWDGHIPMMELFLSRGGDINQANGVGEQALLLATWNGHTEAVKWLLDHGAAISRSGKQWSALHYAVFAGHKAIAKLLIERGADVNGQAPNQASVLMMAAREGQQDLAQTLLEAGADPHAVNDRGETALVWAMRHRNLKIAKMVSTPEEFAQAQAAPPESFGQAVRSAPPPTEIAGLLNSARMAELQGLPVEDLRRALFDAAEAARREGRSLQARSAQPKPAVPRGRPKALLITAKRNQPGSEQARLVYDPPPQAIAAAPRKAATVQRATAADVSDMLRRLREAEAQGTATKEMREALYDAVIGVKRPPAPRQE